MIRFREMEIFLAVVEEGSFAAAARRARISAPSVTRSVALLEQRVGQVLFLRNTRSVSLSDAGKSFLVDCRHIIAEIREAEAAAVGHHIEPCGLLTVAAPVQFGQSFIAPLISDYLNQFPEVSLTCLFVDQKIDMVNENVDLSIRVGELESESIHAIKIGEVRQIVCASPSFLQRYGRPEEPEQLRHKVIVDSTTIGPAQVWHFQSQDRELEIILDSRVTVTTHAAAINIARGGWGITRALLFQVANDVQEGRLELLLEDYEPAPLPVHIVFRDQIKTTSKTYSFADFLIGHIASVGQVTGMEPVLCPSIRK